MKVFPFVSLLSVFVGTALYVDGTSVRDQHSVQVSKHRVTLANSLQPTDCGLAPLRVMPLGDSITYGSGFEGGYRIGLWNYFTQDNLQVDLVGSQANGPLDIDPNHEGHPGKTIQYIRENINTWLSIQRPDVVLLLIGTNDILNPLAHDFANAPYRLSALIHQITLNAPEADIMVASVPPLEDSLANSRVLEFNAEIPTIINAHARWGESVYFVDMFAALTPDDLADGVHPNAAGYAKMAQVWYGALADRLEHHCQNGSN